MGYLPIAWVGDYTFSVAATIALRCTLSIPERQETAMHDIREVAPTLLLRVRAELGQSSDAAAGSDRRIHPA